jgi:hypothetical protein
VNADGWDDIFIASSMDYPHRYGINSLLLNNRGAKFLDAEFLLGIEPRQGGRTHTPWFDVDCLQEGMGTDLCRGRSGTITVMAPLGSRSSVIFDLDGDGDLDIVTNDFNSAPQLLVSDLSQRHPIHWLQVALSGTTSNRSGLGAIVRVRAGEHVTRNAATASRATSQARCPSISGLATPEDRQRRGGVAVGGSRP